MPPHLEAFVAGATGYTGGYVIDELHRIGIMPQAHVRPESSRRAALEKIVGGPGRGMVVDCPWEPDALRERLATLQPAIVFCLIGTTRAQARREGLAGDIYEEVDSGLTRMLVDACVAAEISPLFVYLSAMGVRENAGSPYMKARWRAERAIRESGLRWLIARPGFISGEDREDSRPMERIAARATHAASRMAALFGADGVAARIRPLTGEELASALVELARRQLAADEPKQLAALPDLVSALPRDERTE